MQINHPGKQSPLGSGRKGFWAKNPSPSAVPLKMGESLLAKAITSLLFGTPREMSVEEIEETVRQFVYVAKLAAKTGFDGVEIHAAHGYLLAQFLSPRSNRRTDAYGGSPAKRAKVIVDIITAVRKEVPEGFCVGIKLNSVDHQEETALRECLEQLKCIVDAGVDFLEISGGTYEDPQVGGIQSMKGLHVRVLLRHDTDLYLFRCPVESSPRQSVKPPVQKHAKLSSSTLQLPSDLRSHPCL